MNDMTQPKKLTPAQAAVLTDLLSDRSRFIIWHEYDRKYAMHDDSGHCVRKTVAGKTVNSLKLHGLLEFDQSGLRNGALVPTVDAYVFFGPGRATT